LTESLLPSGSPTVVGTTVMLYRKIGELLGDGGDREAAVALGQRALQLSDPDGPVARNRPAEFKTFLRARGIAAMGRIHAATVKSGGGEPALARRWLEKGLLEFRALESRPSFSNTHRDEMRALEKALESLR
jgi:hypothetical protein